MNYKKQNQNVVVVEPKTNVILMTTIRNWFIDPNDPTVDAKTRANFFQNMRQAKQRLLTEFKQHPKRFRKLAIPDPETVRKTVDRAMFEAFPGPPSGPGVTRLNGHQDPKEGGIETGVPLSDPPISSVIDSDFDSKDPSGNMTTPNIYVLEVKK